MRPMLMAAIAGMSCVSSASAQEIVLQNDSLVDGGSVNVCPCFVATEEAAVWLTSPCDGNIIGIQIFWKSFFGGADQRIEEAIYVYEGSTFPNPGPLKDELLAPLLTDGGLNEFRFVDENQTIPISIPVTEGEQFVVSLAFFNDNAEDIFAPSVVSDDSGCQVGRNAVRVNGNSWQDACSLGVSGDWVIRAIVECSGDPTGAVCLPDGSCAEGLTEADAFALGGVFNGAGSACGDVVCLGACFVPSTGGCLQFDKSTCDAVGGSWQGPGTTTCDSCPADLAAPFGVLNFFDVSAFITAYNAQDPAADVAAPFGTFNFFDVSEYINQYNQGCP
ncbi:MAG: GC-type dockerin domain-anchored protein [Phycisphaerales bacterium]